MARNRGLYNQLSIYVCPDALSSASFNAIECCLRDGGATVLIDIQSPQITHVVCDNSDTPRFASDRNERFYAIVRPEWVFRTFIVQKLLPEDKFSADSALFFSTLAIAPCQIDKDPRKVIDGLITHFGGQIVDDTSDVSGGTHVLLTDRSVPSEASANQSKRVLPQHCPTDIEVVPTIDAWCKWLQEKPMSLDFPIPILCVDFLLWAAGLGECHYVSYSWIEECVRRKTRVPELNFTQHPKEKQSVLKQVAKNRAEIKIQELAIDASARVYLNSRMTLTSSTAELGIARKLNTEGLNSMQEALSGVIVLIAQHIPPRMKEVMTELLKTAKAKVANVPLGSSYKEIVRKVVANASYVVCRYSTGFEYEEAKRQQKQIVSVYCVLTGMGNVPKTLGTIRDILCSPVGQYGGILGMHNFVITLSGFSSRTEPTREDLQIAIQMTGACVLPVLSRSHSTHLLCYEASGEKFKKAESWQFQNILSHQWLFECLSQWKYVSESSYYMSKPRNKASVDTVSPSFPTVKDKENVPSISNVIENTSSLQEKPSLKNNLVATPSRFDVGEILTELQEKVTPSKTTITSDKESAKPVTQPGSDKGQQTDSHQGQQTDSHRDSIGIPDDFEFQFGKKKKNGMVTPSGILSNQRHVMFDEEPVMEPKSKTELNSEEAKLEVKETVEKVAEISGTTTSRKRKSTGNKKTVVSTNEVGGDVVDVKKSKKTSRILSPHGTGEVKYVESVQANGHIASPTRVFLLTGSREECAINESIILAIGGRVSPTGRNYDHNCTHIICSEIKRTEKFVAGCAAGKWILKPSYLEDSRLAGRFVEESLHEWGAQANDVDSMDPRIWPQVASYWRKFRATGKPGCFTGWRFLIHPKSVPPPEMCERIIIASGGLVLALNKSLDLTVTAASASKERPVVALLTVGIAPRDSWIKKFKAHGILCINASFLIDYITKDQLQRPILDQYEL